VGAGAGAGTGAGAGAGVGAAAGGEREDEDAAPVAPPPLSAALPPVDPEAPEPLRDPEPLELLVFVECPGFACATKPASAPTRATAPTHTHFVRLDARRNAASRAVPPRGRAIS
jgi:hypothetical protein